MPNIETPEERARHRAEEWLGLWWHVAAYFVINAFLWALDLVTGGGIQWAYWATIGWGVGMAFHVAAYLIDTRRVEDRKFEQFLEEERRQDQLQR